MKWLLPKTTPKVWYNKVKGATMFLGGMNSALALMNALLFIGIWEGKLNSEGGEERCIMFLCFSLAHFSQFACNVPSFLVSKSIIRGETLTPVLKQFEMEWKELIWVKPDNTIFMIFVFDFLGTIINLKCATALSNPSLNDFIR